MTVAVLDGPINPAVPDLVGAKLITRADSFCEDEKGGVQPGTGTSEASAHATGLASLILGTGAGTGGQPGVRGVAPGATVRHYAVKIGEGGGCELSGVGGFAAGVDQAVADGANIISVSLSGAEDKEKLDAIGRAERAGVIVVVSSNNRGGTDLGWPASGNGVVSVEASDINHDLSDSAVTNPLLAVVAPGVWTRVLSWSDGRWDTYALANGSSVSTAFTSAVLALVWSEHPKASANQMIQTLLRNTTTGKGQLARNDEWGYGGVSVAAMLAADPTKYPDVNPLLRKDADAKPAYSDVVGAPASTSTGAANKAPSAKTADGEGGSLRTLLILGGLVFVLVCVAGIVVAVVVSRRRRTTAQPAPPALYRSVT
ncbi:S8 family peptidase [Pengzhenrongella sp.]|uniref:S8 family peptidase n=1 Tax=Pengzhenrongella sp. TaxID=2888820 RepID=UPI002F93A2E2